MKDFIVQDAGEFYKMQAEDLLDAKVKVVKHLLETSPEIWSETISYYLDIDVKELGELRDFSTTT